MKDRLDKLKSVVADNGLDGLMLTGEVSRFYATGLKTSAGVVLITKEQCLFVTDFRYIEVARERLSQHFIVEMSTMQQKQSGFINAALPRAKKIGIESDVMTVRGLEGWKKALSDCGNKSVRLVPAEDAVRALRAVKDESELEAMRQAQRLAEKALEEVLSGVLRPGVTEREVCAELVYRMLRLGAERMSFDPIVVSGPNGSMPHGVPSERVICRGDFVTIDAGCVYKGYCSDMTRTVAVSEASEEMRRVYQIVLDAQAAGIAAARAGVAGRDIDAAARNVIKDAGYGDYFGHGFGHGLGLEVHESPNANPSEEKQLPAGCVISAEPGIYLPGRFGVRIEDVIVLSETGSENLMRAPKELMIL